MALPARLLGDDEYVVIHTRTHAKALILAVLALLLVGAAVGVGIALLPPTWYPVGPAVVVGIGLVLLCWLVLAPWLRWFTTTYTVTNRRLITRRGVFTKTGTDLPLNRIHEVSLERSLLDRMLGCGTLNVATAAEDGTVVLHDVPHAEDVHTEISQLLFGSEPNPRPRA